ncbi:MAG: phosphatase PAP2 family protein [Azonexus sp.]|jgi:membrane-associated phospholipid phosphatase|nr:phosphatase PAP2 family protein [Azonexus sp.]
MRPAPTRKGWLNPQSAARRAALAALSLAAGLTLFLLLAHSVTPRYSLVTAIDAQIPFLPWSWLFYAGFFPSVIAASAVAKPAAFDAFLRAVLLAFVIGMASFALFPEAVPRPDPAVIDNAFLRQRVTRLWALDPAVNGFPSLHVAVTCLMCRMLITSCRSGLVQTLVIVLGALICLSTLTFKQHTLADALGGVLLAALCAFLSQRWRRPT